MEEELFFVESEDRKFRLFVEDRCLFVSKESMAGQSPVFRRMMYGDFKEAEENTARLKEKKLDDILQLLHAIFPLPKYRTKILFETFDLLMTLADEYEISQLRMDGQQFLEAQLVCLPLGDEMYLTVGVLASKFWFREIVEMCIPHICTFPPAIFDQYKSGFRKNVLFAIIQSKLNRSQLANPCNKSCRCGRKYLTVYCSSCCTNVAFTAGGFHDVACQSKSSAETDPSVAKTCLCGFTYDKILLDD